MFCLMISLELMPEEWCWQQKSTRGGLPQQPDVAKVWQAWYPTDCAALRIHQLPLNEIFCFLQLLPRHTREDCLHSYKHILITIFATDRSKLILSWRNQQSHFQRDKVSPFYSSHCRSTFLASFLWGQNTEWRKKKK